MNNNPFTDNYVFNLLKGFAVKETKEEITKLYIDGRINKDEFIKRMENAK